MPKDPALQATQLLISHLCHEMVSPIGAINNGVELIEELGASDFDGDAMALIAQSGKNAAAKLRFFRLAYGSAGASADLKPADARSALVDLLASEGRVDLAWPDVEPRPYAAGAIQMLMNLVVLMAGALPRGGLLGVTLSAVASGCQASIRASGTLVRLQEPIRSLIQGQTVAADHRTIHAEYCQRLAGALNTPLRLEDQGEDLVLHVMLRLDADDRLIG